eukprot:6454791-Amphidinium_carterae.1
MSAEQTRAELQRLQSTISVDLYFRLVALLEVDVNLMPPHPAIHQMDDEDVVHVQNKTRTDVPTVVPSVPADPVPVEPVLAKALPKKAKAPPQKLPEDRVPVPVTEPKVPEQD